jgi:hypothetical protein
VLKSISSRGFGIFSNPGPEPSKRVPAHAQGGRGLLRNAAPCRRLCRWSMFGEPKTFKKCWSSRSRSHRTWPRAMRETCQQHQPASRISINAVTPNQPPRRAAPRQQPAQTSRQGTTQPGQAVLPNSARGAERSLACSYNSQVSKVLLHTSTPDDVVTVDSPVIWSLAAPVLLLSPEPLPWPSCRCCCHRRLA